MPNLEELIKIREEAIKEVSEEIEKVEEFLKKGATELYVEVITPDIESSANNHLFTDIGITIDYTNEISSTKLNEKFSKSLEALEEVAKGDANKVFIPFEATSALGALGAMKEVVTDKKENEKK